jgi:hypothetical protein
VDNAPQLIHDEIAMIHLAIHIAGQNCGNGTRQNKDAKRLATISVAGHFVDRVLF